MAPTMHPRRLTNTSIMITPPRFNWSKVMPMYNASQRTFSSRDALSVARFFSAKNSFSHCQRSPLCSPTSLHLWRAHDDPYTGESRYSCRSGPSSTLSCLDNALHVSRNLSHSAQVGTSHTGTLHLSPEASPESCTRAPRSLNGWSRRFLLLVCDQARSVGWCVFLHTEINVGSSLTMDDTGAKARASSCNLASPIESSTLECQPQRSIIKKTADWHTKLSHGSIDGSVNPVQGACNRCPWSQSALFVHCINGLAAVAAARPAKVPSQLFRREWLLESVEVQQERHRDKPLGVP